MIDLQLEIDILTADFTFRLSEILHQRFGIPRGELARIASDRAIADPIEQLWQMLEIEIEQK
jgi:hypothetical protein